MHWVTWDAKYLRWWDRCLVLVLAWQMHSLHTIGEHDWNQAILWPFSTLHFSICSYHVIANPLERKMTMPKAIFMCLLVWCYTIPWALFPYFQIWGRFAPGNSRWRFPNCFRIIFGHFSEGYLTSCTFDYLTDNYDTRFFVGVLFTFSYCIPMSLIVYYYSQIVKHVFSHEKKLREQAKKMNVDSLRANQGANSQSAEVRIAKAAITICFLFVACE